MSETIDYNKEQEKELNNLKQCQNEKNLDSCNSCELIIDCKIRDKFVYATYAKMNKGATGGFEF
jgi:hypothetical protein